MTASAFFSAILAVLQAIPVFQKWVEQFIAWYVNAQIESMSAENRDAIRKAIETHDQREIEKAVGNPRSGEPSGLPGTVIIDNPPPGVKP